MNPVNPIPSSRVLSYRSASRPRPPGRPVLSILGIGLALLPGLILVAGPIASLSPYAWDACYLTEVGTTRPGKYVPTAYFQLVAQGIGRGGGMRMQTGYVVFLCGASDEPGCIGFDLRAMTCQLNSYQGQQSGLLPLSRQAMLSYVSLAGYAPGDPEAQAVASALWDEVRRLKDGPHEPQIASSMRTRPIGTFEYAPTERRFLAISGFSLRGRSPTTGLPWYTPWVLPLWLLAWWQLSRLPMRRYRSKLRAFAAAEATIDGERKEKGFP